MKKKFYGMLAAVLIASCICVPQVKVQAEDVYDDSDWSDSWYDNDVTPIPDLTNVTIDKPVRPVIRRKQTIIIMARRCQHIDLPFRIHRVH